MAGGDLPVCAGMARKGPTIGVSLRMCGFGRSQGRSALLPQGEGLVFNTLPATGDPQRDRLLAEILQVHEQTRALSVELVGPMELPAELTMQQLRVLGLVAQEPGLTGQELGARLGVSAPTASGLVERLVEKGMLERTDDATDRRLRRLRLTEEGLHVLGGLDATMGKLFAAVIPPIPIEDLHAIKAGSEAMLRAVRTALELRDC